MDTELAEMDTELAEMDTGTCRDEYRNLQRWIQELAEMNTGTCRGNLAYITIYDICIPNPNIY